MQNTARVEPCKQSAQAAATSAGEMPVRRQTTIVTVTYGDRLVYLRRLIEQAFAFEQITRVLVVSNASTAPLEQLTSRWPGQVHIIPLAQNTGSANGYAVGLEAALAEAVRLEAARQAAAQQAAAQAARAEAERQAVAREEATRQEAMRLEAMRQDADKIPVIQKMISESVDIPTLLKSL